VAIYTSLVGVQLSYALLGIFMKTQLSKGTNSLLLIVCSNATGFLVLTPFAFFLEKKERPKMSFSLAAQFFLVALTGVCAFQALLLMGLKNTTPAFASAMPNLGPAIIFLMASVLGTEKVDIKSRHSQFKIIGTIVCVCGAMTMSFLQGPALSKIWSHFGNDIHTEKTIHLQQEDSHKMMIGCVYLVSAVVIFSSSLMLQANVLKKYPATLSMTAITSLLGCIQITILKIIIERGVNTTSWLLDWSGLLAGAYLGVVCNGLSFTLQLWCLKKKGPVFVSIFSPVSTIFSAILSGETLRLG
ncbi:hypothetical protein KI387_003742, partial [Taxus chinensis]